MSVDQYARTERSHATHAVTQGCDLAHEVHAMLVGGAHEQGVFEQLRSLRLRITVIGALVVAPLWVIAYATIVPRLQ